MRAVFMGTPASAVPTLEVLSGIAEVVCVITRPDRPRGRSKRPSPPPVKEAATKLGLGVAQPPNAEELMRTLRQAGPCDVALVVAFGMILPQGVLEYPAAGCVNVHFSLLPRWRGAAPVERAIEAGDGVTGVSLMLMNEGLDTGPIIGRRELEVMPEETAGQLTARLAELSGAIITDTFADYVNGAVIPRPQTNGATYAPKLQTEDARLDVVHEAYVLALKVRAFNPRPGAYLMDGDRRLKVWQAAVAPDAEKLSPGVLSLSDERVLLGTGSDPLDLIEVQPEGGRRMSGADWERGHHPGKLR